MSIPFSQSTQGLLIDSRLDALEATDTANAQVLTNLAKPINEAANSRFQVVPDLPAARKLVIGVGGVPTGAQRAAATATSITTGTSSPTITFSAAHGFRAGELLLAPVTAAATAAGLNQCWLQVMTAPTTTTITVSIPRGMTAAAATDANGSWTVMTRGDDTGVTGDLMSGDDLGKWDKSSSLKVWIEDDPTLLALFPGSSRVLLVQKGSASSERLYYWFGQGGQGRYMGFKRGFGAAVVSLSGSLVSPMVINNGTVTLGTGSTSNARTWVSHSQTVTGTGFYADGLQFDGASGAYYVVDAFTRIPGRKPQDGDQCSPPGPIRPQGSITIGTLNGATITFPSSPDSNGYYSWPISVYQESSGRLGPDVKVLHWNLEGVSQVWGALLGSRERIGNPTTFGHVCSANGHTLSGPVSPVTVTRSFSAGVVTLTITCTDPHGAINGQPCEIRGLTPSVYNVKGHFIRNSDTVLTYQFAAGADPGAISGTASLLISHYDASRCELNLYQGSFALYSVTPGTVWEFVSMDTSRLVA